MAMFTNIETSSPSNVAIIMLFLIVKFRLILSAMKPCTENLAIVLV